MENPTKILFCVLVLAVLVCLVGCKKVDTSEGGDEVSYLSEGEEAAPSETTDAAVAEEPAAEAETTEAAPVEAAKPVSSGNEVSVYEGDLVQLKVSGTDPDGDAVTYKFSSPLDENGRWQTRVGDKGDYEVKVTASDGKSETTKTLKIKVLSKNNAPVMEKIADLTVKEGETVSFSPKVLDPDGDAVTVKYSGWMTSNTYATGYNDQGEHVVTITASDGSLETSQNVKVTVQDVNRAPEFEITVQ